MPPNTPTDTPPAGPSITLRSFRPNSDDDRFVIPELIGKDMYRLRELCPRLPQQGVLLDCGAHIGVFSVMFAAFCPRWRIVAYEPNPENFRHLQLNCGANGPIEARQCAVGKSAGRAQLFDQGDTGRWSMTPETAASNGAGSVVPLASVEVELIDLGAEMLSLASSDYLALKIDLEGYEAELLAALPDAALSRIDLLLLEEHHLPVDHRRLQESGLLLLFHPFNMPRHHVYYRPESAPNQEAAR